MMFSLKEICDLRCGELRRTLAIQNRKDSRRRVTANGIIEILRSAFSATVPGQKSWVRHLWLDYQVM